MIDDRGWQWIEGLIAKIEATDGITNGIMTAKASFFMCWAMSSPQKCAEMSRMSKHSSGYRTEIMCNKSGKDSSHPELSRSPASRRHACAQSVQHGRKANDTPDDIQ